MTKPITWVERNKASLIIHRIRNQKNLTDTAKIFGLCPSYITLAEKKTRRKDNPDLYQCPAYAIQKILDHVAKNE